MRNNDTRTNHVSTSQRLRAIVLALAMLVTQVGDLVPAIAESPAVEETALVEQVRTEEKQEEPAAQPEVQAEEKQAEPAVQPEVKAEEKQAEPAVQPKAQAEEKQEETSAQPEAQAEEKQEESSAQTEAKAEEEQEAPAAQAKAEGDEKQEDPAEQPEAVADPETEAPAEGNEPEAEPEEQEAEKPDASSFEIPLPDVNAELLVGESCRVKLEKAGEFFIVKLTVKKSEALVIAASDLDAWVEVRRADVPAGRGDRYESKDGELFASFQAKAGIYLLTFVANRGYTGSFAVRVDSAAKYNEETPAESTEEAEAAEGVTAEEEVTETEPAEDEVTETEPAEDEVTETEPAEDEVTETEPAEDEVTETEPSEDEVTETEPTEDEVTETEANKDEVAVVDVEVVPVTDEQTNDETTEDETAEGETAEDETAEDETAEGETAEDETAEDEAEAVSSFKYAFAGIDDAQLVSYILAQFEIYQTLQDVTVSDPEAVELDEDLCLTARAYFDAVTLTVVSDAGETFEIILTNPDPDAVAEEETEVAETLEVTAEAKTIDGDMADAYINAIKALENFAGRRMMKSAPATRNAEDETKGGDKPAAPETRYAAFDIEPNTDEEAKEYKVNVTGLNIDLETPKGMKAEITGATLYHFYDPENYANYETLPVEVSCDGSAIVGFEYVTTTGFSPYVLKYTVDFTYVDVEGEEHTWSFPGNGEYTLESILAALGIEYEAIESAELELTEAVDEVDDTALYLTGDAETGYVLHSDEAFDDTYLLTVVADGKIYAITVTDAQGGDVTITFYNVDGTTVDTAANPGTYNYMVLFNGWGGGVQAITPVGLSNGVMSATFDGSVNIEEPQIGNRDNFVLIRYIGSGVPDINTFAGNNWYNESLVSEKIELKNGSDVGLYTITEMSHTPGAHYTVKAQKKDAYIVNLQFRAQDYDPNNNPGAGFVTPGVTEGAPAMRQYAFTRVLLADAGGQFVGYAVSPISTNASTNSVAVTEFVMFNQPVLDLNAAVESGNKMSYTQAKAAGYSVPDGQGSGAYVRIGYKDQNQTPNWKDFDTQANGLSTGDPEGYTFAGQIRGVQDQRTVNLRVADPTYYKVKVDCGSEPLTLPTGADVYALVNATTSTSNLYAYAKITAANTADGGKTFELDIPNEGWFQETGYNTYITGTNQISGHERNVTVSLAAVTAGTTVNNPSDIISKAIPVLGYVNTHEVISYPSIYNGNFDPEANPVQRTFENNVYTDHVYLKKNADKIASLYLEDLLAHYNVITICPNTDGRPGQGDFLDQNHTMGGILIRGDLLSGGSFTNIGSATNATWPSVVGGSLPANVFTGLIGGGQFNAGGQNPNPINHHNFYIGSSNNMAGYIVNGTEYKAENNATPAATNPYYSLNGYGETVISDDFVEWNTLQNNILNLSDALLNNADRVIKDADIVNGKVYINVGEHVRMETTSNPTVVIVGEEGWTVNNEWASAKGTVISYDIQGGTQVPTLMLQNGSNGTPFGMAAAENGPGLSVVLNYPKAEHVTDNGDTVYGHVLAPRGLITTNFQYNGALVGNNVEVGGQAEGHLWPYRGGKLITSSEGFVVQKTVNNALPTSGQVYDFILEELKYVDGSDNQFAWQEKERKQNNGQRVAFTEINYGVPANDGHYIEVERDSNNKIVSVTYYYRITEDPVSVTDGCSPDLTQYYIKVIVNVEYKGDDTIVTDTTMYRKQAKSSDTGYNPNLTDPEAIDALEECDKNDVRFNNATSMLKLYKSFTFDGEAVDISKLTEAQKKALKFTITTNEPVYMMVEDDEGGQTAQLFDETVTKYVVWDTANGGIHGRRATLTTTESYFTFNDFRDGMLVLEGLPLGVYTIVETDGDKVFEGYTWSKATVKVGRDEETQPTAFNDPITSVTTNAELVAEDFTQIFFVNEYKSKKTEVQATKVWDDGNDKYGLRPESVQLRLEGTYTDDKGKVFYLTDSYDIPYVQAVTGDAVDVYKKTETVEGVEVTTYKTAEQYAELTDEEKAGYTKVATLEGQTAVWANLPILVHGYPVTYTVYELSVDGYTTAESACTYNEDTNTWEAFIVNTLELGALEVSKNMFVDNVQVSEPAEGEEDTVNTFFWEQPFYVTVSYEDVDGKTWFLTSTDGESVQATTAPANAYFEVTPKTSLLFTGLAYTEYTINEYMKQGAGDSATYIDVGNINSMVFVEATSKTTDSVIVNQAYTPAVEDDPTTEAVETAAATGAAAESTLVNYYTKGKYCIAVTKQWLVNGKVFVPDDSTTLTVRLERSIDGNAWEPANFSLDGSENPTTATATLTKANNWSAVAIGMDQMDVNGNRYQYRWVEMNGNTVAETGTVINGWIVGKSELIQSTTKDGTTLIFLTKLVNSKVTFTPHVNKIVEGDGAPEQTYSFTLSDKTAEADQVKETLGATTASVVGAGTAEFGEISYSDVGTFIYEISEDPANPAVPGMTYNVGDKKITVTVVTEKDDNGVLKLRSATYAGGNGDGKDSITNKYETGTLEISKAVVSDNPADKGVEFTFTVELKNADDTALADGTYGAYTVSGGKITGIKLHGGDTAVIPDLPVGTTYTVTEAAATGFTNTEKTGDEGAIEADKTAKAAFENTRDTGKLTLTKTVVSQLDSDKEATYKFTITLDANIDKEFNGVQFTDGIATVQLTGADGSNSKTITGLPVGVDYSITEETPNGMTVTWTGSTTGTVEEDGTKVIAKNTRDTGSLEIDKKVFVDGADKTSAYNNKSFYVKVKGVINGTTYYVTSDSGVLSKTDDKKVFEVKPGTKLTISNLPVGEYTATEVLADGTAVNATNAPGEMGSMTFLFDLSRTEETVTVGKYVQGQASGGASQTADIGKIAEVSLVNAYTAGKYCIAVTKQWLVNGKTYVDDSLTVTVKLQRRLNKEGAEWTDVDGQTGVVLNKTNNWAYDAVGMEQMDENGVRYEYQWVETVPTGWIQGISETVQSATKDGTVLIFLTKLNNIRVTAQPEVTKKVTGNTDEEAYNPDELFKFTITGIQAELDDGTTIYTNEMPAPDPAEVEIKADGKGVFGELEFTRPGKYYYNIKENTPDNPTTGMDYDDEAKQFVVTVGEKDGLLTVATVYYDGPDNVQSLTVENTYNLVTAQPKVTKKVTGDMTAPSYDKDKTFTFILRAKEGAPTPEADGETVTVKADGVPGVFGKITFTETGTYEYTIIETKGTDTGWTYDVDDEGNPVEHKVTVTVTKVNGKLVADVKYDEKDTLEVTNTYKTASLKVTKTVDGLPASLKNTTIYLVSVKGSDGNYYGLNGAVTGTKEHWVEIKDGDANAAVWNNLPVGLTYTVTEKVELAGVSGYTLASTTYKVGEEETNKTGLVKGETTEVKITNVYEQDLTKASVKKVWNNPTNDPSAEIPDSLTVYLMVGADRVKDEDGNEIKVTLLKSDNWAEKEVPGLPKFDASGAEINYTWSEDQDGLPVGWTFSGATLEGTLTTLENTYAPGKTSVSVQKIWDDTNNQDKSRPDKVYVQLSATYVNNDGETVTVDLAAEGITVNVELNEGNHWSHLWGNLNEKTGEGYAITYTVTEVQDSDGTPITGGKITFSTGAEYTVKVEGDAAAGFTVTNTYKPGTVDIPVRKIWDDNNDQDGVRPTSVLVILYAGDKPVDEHYVDVDGEWAYTFTGKPAKADGVDIVYTVKEYKNVDLTAEYEQVGEPTLKDGVWEITNKHEPEKVTVEITKTWDDDNNRDGLRLTAEQYKDAVSLYVGNEQFNESTLDDDQKTVTDNGDGTYTVTYTGLPKYNGTKDENGKAVAIVYTVHENVAAIAEYTADPANGVVEPDGTITNTHEIAKVSVEITKTWADKDDIDGLRPELEEYIDMVHLYKGEGEDAEEVTDALKTATDHNNGKYTIIWTGLPKYERVAREDGTTESVEIVYTAKEDLVDQYEADPEDGSIALTLDGDTYKGEITNTHEPETVDIEGKKTWVGDERYSEIFRPESIKVTLYDGETVVDSTTVTPNEDGKWSYEFKDLPKNKRVEGEDDEDDKTVEIAYTVVETIEPEEIAELYETAVNGYNITNTLKTSMLKLYKAFKFNGNPVTLTDEQKAKLKFTVTTEIDGTTYYVIYDATDADGNIHGKWALLTETESSFSYKDFSDGMLVLENLPVGKYTVTESMAEGGMIEGYTWSEASVKVGRGGTANKMADGDEEMTTEATLTTDDFTQVFFENEFTQDLGQLIVTKKVSMTEGSSAIPADKTFRIAVYSQAAPAEGETEGAKTYYATNGSVVTEDNKWVEFKKDQSITWINLPVGTYFVEEDKDGAKVDDYELAVSYSDEDGVEVKVLAEGDEAPETTVTNKYDEHKGELQVTKEVVVTEGSAAIEVTEWEIAVHDAEGKYYSLSGEVVTGDDIWQTITKDQTLTWSNLSLGTYTVEEKHADAELEGYTLTVDGEGEVEVYYVAPVTETEEGEPAEEEEPASVTITNTYDQNVGSLTVTKKVVAPADVQLDGVKFKIAVVSGAGTEEDPYVYWLTDGTAAEGEKYYEFEDGTSLTWESLLEGDYAILEDKDAATVEGAELSVSGIGKVVVKKGEKTDATVTNDYTGDVGSLEIIKNFEFGSDPEPADIELAGLKFTVTGQNDYTQTVWYAQFENGKYTIPELPLGDYTVVEENEDKILAALNYSLVSKVSDPENGKVAVTTGDPVKVTLTNTYKLDKGSLAITKTFAGTENLTAEELAKLDALSFELTKPDGTKATETYGNFKTYTVTDGKYTEDADGTVKAWVLNDLPLGTYVVTETNADGLLTSVNYSFVAAGSTDTGSAAVAKDKTAEVKLTNKYAPDLGKLAIVKNFEGIPADADTAKLAFTVKAGEKFVNKAGELVDADPKITYADFTNGVLEIKNLPVGTYAVAETNAGELIENYTLVADKSTTDATAQVKKDETVIVTLKNAYEEKLGKLTIVKHFEGTDDVDEAVLGNLAFRVTNEDGEIVEQVFYSQFDGDSHTIKDLPMGTYKVEELNADSLIANYTFVADESTTEGEAELTEADEEIVIELENKYEEDLGSLKVIKTFVGDFPEDTDLSKLSFTVTGPDGSDVAEFTYGEFEEVDGLLCYLLEELPVGLYVVTETGAEGLIDGYTLVAADSTTTETVTVVKNDTVEAELINTYEEDLGQLVLVKNFEGIPDDADVSELQFHITGPKDYDKTVTFAQFEDGVYTIDKLPVGTYNVSETNADDLILNYNLVSSIESTDVDVEKDQATVAVFTNMYEPETTEVPVKKIWDDSNDNDGKRPGSVTVALLADGEKVQTAVLTLANGWAYTFADLPVYEMKDGEKTEITYTVMELDEEGNIVGEGKAYNDDYIVGYEEGEKGEQIIKNAHEPEVTTATVVKVWNDNNDAAGKRSETKIKVTLLANNEPVAKYTDIELPYTGSDEDITYTPGDNEWTLTVNNLPQYKEGVYQTYSWIETIGEGSDYTMTYINTEIVTEKPETEAETGETESEEAAVAKVVGIKTTITNTYATNRYCLEVLKIWKDDNDSAGFRPTKLKVTLMKEVDGEPVAFGENELLDAEGKPIQTEYTLEEKNHWTAMATGLPKGEFTYVWVEDETELGKYKSETETVGTITYLTNTYVPEQKQVKITKIWNDESDQDGIRPDHIDVKLLADGELVKTLRLEAAAAEATEPAADDVPVETADAGEGSEAEETANDSDTWTLTVTNLPKYVKGKEIVYTFAEYPIAGYETKVGELTFNETDNIWEIKIENTHTPEKTITAVEKVWEDAENQDGKRPESVTMILYANNEPTGITVTLAETKADQDYTEATVEAYKDAEFDLSSPLEAYVTNLPKYVNGVEQTYTWLENTAELEGTGYTIQAVELAADSYTVGEGEDAGEIPGLRTVITNTYKPDRFCLTVLKVWDDANNQDGLRPASVTVRLLANGETAKYPDGTTVEDKTLSEANHWTAMVTGLPIMADGKAIEYSWFEVKVPEGYEAEQTVKVDDSRITTITNTHKPAETQISVKKVWVDGENQDGIQPKAVTVELLANGVPTAEATLNEANTWSYTFEKLPVKAEGKDITYTVREIDAPEGYTVAVSGDAETGFTVTNTHEPETVEVTVLKVWDDNDNNDGKRPGSIVVALQADGQPAKDAEGGDITVTLSDASKWTAVAKDLPKFKGGKEIAYTWTEGEYEGYTLTSNETVGYVTTITNAHEPETTATEVQKIWDDNNNKHKKQPESIVVELQANGKTIGTEILNQGNSWYAKRENLPKYENKQPIVYSWVESTVPEGYRMELKVDESTGITNITNTYLVGKLVIEKTFSENVTGMDEIKNLEFTVTGPDYEKTVKYSEFTDGKYTIEDLIPGRYTVIEENAFELIADYTLNVTDSTISGSAAVEADKEAKITLKNTYVEDLGDLVIAKEWCFSPADAVDTEEMKNLKVTVQNSEGYYVDVKDGKGVITDKKAEADKVELTIADGSRLTIKDLPIDTYTVKETNANDLITGYSVNATVASVTTGSAKTAKDAEVTIVLKNNYERDYAKLTLKKTWKIEGQTEVPDSAKNGLRFEITSDDVKGFEKITVYYAQFAGKDSFTVENLPVGTYKVTEYDYEKLLDSYGYDFTKGTTEGTATLVKDGEGTVELSNEYTERVGGLTITKTFSGNPEDADLSGLTFEITGPNGYSKTVKYSEFTDGAYRLDNLVEGEYTVKETNAETLIDQYHLLATSETEGSAKVSKTTAGSVALKNNYAPDLGALTILKTFAGNPEDADLSGLTFEITGPNDYSKTVKYSEFTDGAYTIKDLFAGAYTIKETNADSLIPNYTLLTASVTTGKADVKVEETAAVMLINIYEQDTGSLTLAKNFEGTPEGANLNGLTFKITGPDGYSETVTYGAFSGGKYTIKNLPVGEYKVEETNAGKLIANYTLNTESVTTGSATITKNKTVTVTLTNKYDQDLGSLVIEKAFSGVSPTDEVVSALTFRVFGPDGFDKTVTYSEFTDGKYTFKDIAVGDYLVYETNPAYLSANLLLLTSSKTSDTAAVVKGKTATVSLENNYENSTTSVLIRKVWKDMEDLDGSRPDELKVTLLADSKPIDVVTLNEGNEWTAEVTDLPLYAGARKIEYTWDEGTVEGYQLTESKTLGNLTTLTNTHEPEFTSATVVKVWEDRNNAQKMRPISIWATLSNGMTVVLSEENNWTATIDNLPKYKDGEEIVYTWKEQEILGYKQKSVVVDGTTTTFTNTIPGRPGTPKEPEPAPSVVIINHVGDCFD